MLPRLRKLKFTSLNLHTSLRSEQFRIALERLRNPWQQVSAAHFIAQKLPRWATENEFFLLFHPRFHVINNRRKSFSVSIPNYARLVEIKLNTSLGRSECMEKKFIQFHRTLASVVRSLYVFRTYISLRTRAHCLPQE